MNNSLSAHPLTLGLRTAWFGGCLTFAVMLSPLAWGQTPQSSQGPSVIQGAPADAPVVPDEFDGDLRNLPASARRFVAPVNVNPRRRMPPSRSGSSAHQPDVLRGAKDDGRRPSSFDTPLLNFEGQSSPGVSNPDTIGDVGRRHYIQMINGAGGASFKLFDKSGNVLVNETSLGSLARPGTRCETGSGDPIVLYDPLARRWMMSEIAAKVATQPDFLCVYISKSSDPVTGGWWNYKFQTLGFPDYPHYAVWPDAYYVGVNEVGGPEGDVSSAYALDRKQMLLGRPAGFNRFKTAQLPGFLSFNELTPADLDGTPPRGGEPAYFVRHVDDEFHFGANTSGDYMEVWAFHADFDRPARASFTRLPNVRIADFDSKICDNGPDECITQPATSQRLDSLPQMTLWRVQYRRFGSVDTLVGNFTVDATGQDQAGVRWFVLTKTNQSQWAVSQQGTYAPGSTHRWMASIAMDRCGNIALGHNVSSLTVFPGLRYTGRLSSDPPGTLPRGENSIVAGLSPYTAFNRWGDYSSMNVDPSDGRTFWFTGEYMNGSGEWATRIASFRFAECQAEADDEDDD